MTDDQGKTLKEEFIDRLEKAKGRLQQSFPEIQQLIKTSNAVEVARKIIDPAQSIFKQFADDIQLKDLFAKAEALVANANLTFTKAVSGRDVFGRILKESGGKENTIEGNAFKKSGAEEDAIEKEEKASAKTKSENTLLSHSPPKL
jgi:transposase